MESNQIEVESQNKTQKMSSNNVQTTELHEDHREKNILLAKNLNDVKMDLRTKKKDLMALKNQLRQEKQRNSMLQSEQMSLVNRIDHLKKQLDETFLKSTFGYIQLSQQLDEMQGENGRLENGTANEATATAAGSTMQSTLLAKIKRMSESFLQSDASFAEAGPSRRSLNDSNATLQQSTLSFDSFQMGLNSTFVKNDSDDSILDVTFLADEPNNNSRAAPYPLNGIENVTVRKNKKTTKIGQSKGKSKIARSLFLHQQENQSMATDTNDDDPASKTFVLRRRQPCRSLKKVDYNETSFRRRK